MGPEFPEFFGQFFSFYESLGYFYIFILLKGMKEFFNNLFFDY